ncbi:MAG: histidine phosphatase family protein [Bacteroidota bacterium]
MKKLLLVRHAKAGSHDMKDFDRPLTDRGLHDAAVIADKLKKAELIPEYVITSPALRTKTTANILAKILAVKNSGDNKHIYEANTHDLLKTINHLPDEYSFIALVGHNPGISQILYELTGEMREMSPADAALIGFDFDEWEMVHTDTGKLAWYDSPKNN